MSTKAFSASRVTTHVVSSKTPKTGVMVGIIESASAEMALNAEIQMETGSYFGVDEIIHGGQGSFNLGRAQHQNPNFDWGSLGVVPQRHEYSTFSSFSIRFFDTGTKKMLAVCRRCVPNHHGVNWSAQGKVMTNMSGMCVYYAMASEINP